MTQQEHMRLIYSLLKKISKKNVDTKSVVNEITFNIKGKKVTLKQILANPYKIQTKQWSGVYSKVKQYYRALC